MLIVVSGAWLATVGSPTVALEFMRIENVLKKSVIIKAVSGLLGGVLGVFVSRITAEAGSS